MKTEQLKPFLHLVKPCKCCDCACCGCLPHLDVFYIENGANVQIGKITLPCQCCNRQLEVEDAMGNMVFHLEASCMQCGICCPGWPCETCQTVTFEMHAGGQQVGILEKRTKGCIQAMIADADNFVCTFPQQFATKEVRALLLAATLMVDYMWFEDNKERGGHH